MKQQIFYLALGLLILVGIMSVKAEESPDFTESLKTCTNYYENQTIKLQDLNLTTIREIHGWKNGKCSYKETVSTADKKYSVNCNLSQEHINELVKTMENFNQSSKDLDLNDFEQIQNSSVATSWSKYLQNPEICSIELK